MLAARWADFTDFLHRVSAQVRAHQQHDAFRAARPTAAADVGSAIERVVRDGQIVIGDAAAIAVIPPAATDGHVVAAFAYESIGYLEDPDRLLLEMS
ncbi:hypothetical protein [Sorangium sp. So ce1151]|uniref:hypothetical protein n=1 Tax=Sorangium sp. So ce1151 TaxID=3133332 RepID=UPI003F63FB1A